MLRFNKNRLSLQEDIKLLVDIDGCWLAGGALRTAFSPTDTLIDYDMFFKHKIALAQAKMFLETLQYKLIFQCPEGKLTSFQKDNVKIQLVTEDYYIDIEDLLNRFDITSCRFAFDGKYIYGFYSSVADVKRNRINLYNISHPNSTMKRIQKYIKKGYTLTNSAVDKFVDSVYNAGVNNQLLDRRFYID